MEPQEDLDIAGYRAAHVDPLAAAAPQIAAEQSDLLIRIAREPGEPRGARAGAKAVDRPIRVTMREHLERAEADVVQARNDAKLFEISLQRPLRRRQ